MHIVRKLKTLRKFKVRSKSIFGNDVELSLDDLAKNRKKWRISKK